MDTFKKLKVILQKDEVKKFKNLLFLMFLGAIFETFSIGLILPFISLVSEPGSVNSNSILSSIFAFLKFKSVNTFLIVCSLVLILAFILKNCYLSFYTFYQNRVLFRAQADVSHRLLKTYMFKNYAFHLKRNSSELLRNINIEVSQLFSGVIMSGLIVLSEGIIVFCIFLFILVIEPQVTVPTVLFLGIASIVFLIIFRKKTDVAGKNQQTYGRNVFKWISQGIQGIKEIKILRKERYFLDHYQKNMYEYTKSVAYNSSLNQLPRLYIETVSIVSILIVISIVLLQGRDPRTIMPLLAVFAVSAFRIMPSINRILGGLTSIRYYKSSVDIIYRDNHEESEEDGSEKAVPAGIANIKFTKSIVINDLSYKYSDSKENVIRNASMEIPLGSSIAIIGPSGAGKTTLVDVILGLLKATEGTIEVDGTNIYRNLRSWQSKIGYVPQVVYLLDDTVENNIAFGLEEGSAKEEEILEALDLAQMKEYVQSLPGGLKSRVGERGVNLSGGQRQRLGIARALFRNPDVLVFDEATSSLDAETEKEVINSINRLKGKKTIIIITHKLNTITNCDYIFKIKNGYLTQIDLEGNIL